MNPRDEPLSIVERELRDAWLCAIEIHAADPTPETWQRRIGAHGAYEAVYNWNRSK